jgi:hypothetical protein
MLNNIQVEEIARIIREHVGVLIYHLVGVSPVNIQSLRERGIIDATVSGSAIADAYLFGVLASLDPATMSSSFAVLKSTIRSLPLSEIEKASIQWLNDSAALYCTGLGNRIEATTMRIIHDAAKEAAMVGAIRSTLSTAARDRKTRGEMVTMLRRATEDLQRDWHRIVNTEMHSARTQGIAHGIARQFGDGSHVIVRPHPDCCDLCRDAFLLRGRPRVFALADLAARNNVDMTAAEIRKVPGLPPVHPHCLCEVSYFNPKIHEFDKLGRVVFKATKED